MSLMTLEARPVSVAVRPFALRLWLPTSLLFALLAPFALLLLPILYLTPRAFLPRPAATLFGLGGLLFSLSGTLIDVDTAEAQIRIHLI